MVPEEWAMVVATLEGVHFLVYSFDR